MYGNMAGIGILSLILTGCPATLMVSIKNNASSPIYYEFSPGRFSEIGENEVSEEVYNFGCTKIKQGDEIFYFRMEWPPVGYVKRGVFSSRASAAFNDGGEFLLFAKENNNAHPLIADGCH